MSASRVEDNYSASSLVCQARHERFAAKLDIHLRLCREEDLPALEWMGLFSGHRQIFHAAFVQQHRGEGLMLLAVSNSFPVAQVWLDFARRGSVSCPRLWAMRVFPPLQRTGIGSWLLRCAEEIALARGAEAVELGVEEGNEGARRFYARHGYLVVEWRRETLLYGAEDDPLTVSVVQEMMRKRLPC